MAHQNLRFKVDQNNIKDWQPIFGAEHHGTFYMIYIRITKHEKKPNIGGKEMHFYTCDFKLQNFRGAITMGLVRVDETTSFSTVDRLEELGEILNINIYVKPFTKQDELLDIPISIDRPIEKGLTAVMNVFLQDPPINLFKWSDLDKSLYINPYSHSRDGDHYNEISSRPVGSKTPFPTPTPTDSALIRELGFCLPDIIMFL